jgi:hypothetical protein
MQSLTEEQCLDWVRSRGHRFDGEPGFYHLQPSDYRTIRFDIPSDAGRRVALARLLWEALGASQPETLLWVTGWSIWPSGEHMPLAASLRRDLGEGRPLAIAPGHVFRIGEDDDAISLLTVACLFLWDCYLLAPSGELALFLSHDEFAVVHARNPDASIPLERRLDIFGLPVRIDS